MIVIKCPECGEETSLPESYGEERFGGEVKSSEGGVRLLVAVIKKGISMILGNTMKKTVLAIIILGLVLLNSVAIVGASPDLTEAGKKYIAENFGIDGCWVYSGLTWDVHGKQGEIASMSSGTGGFMSDLTCVATDHIVLKTPRTGTFYLSDVVTGNGGNAITDSDIFEIVDNDGYPAGEAQYCICAIPKEVKAYIAKNYGDGNCVTATSPDAFDLACRLGTLTTPLPTGYTSDTLCSGQILDWVYANKGWCISGPIHNLNTGDNFYTIQAAITSSDTIDGHTITVDSGIYFENVNVTKRLTLKGVDTGGGKPVIDAIGSWSTITLSVDGIILEGFTITYSGSRIGSEGLAVTSNDNIITNNTVNTAGNTFNGISIDSHNNTVTGNTVTNSGTGISLHSSSNNTITCNNVSNNSGTGIRLIRSYCNNITSNTFVTDGLTVWSSYQNTVKENIVNGKPLVYLEDVSDTEVADAGQVILVNCNNITVETLELSNTSVGVALWETDDSIVSNNNLCNNRYGIDLYDSCNNTITGNYVSNNDWGGINFWNSHKNALSYNTFVNDGLYSRDSYENTVEENTVNGKPLVYLEDTSDIEITDAGQVILVNCNNITVEHLELSNTSVGVTLWGSDDSKILNNTVYNNSGGGIYLCSSGNNTISGNTASNNGYGIRIYPRNYLDSSCNNNIITGNTTSNNYRGIIIISSSNNVVSNNIASNNSQNGFTFYSSNNTISGNTACNNGDGIYFGHSNNNTISSNTACINDNGIHFSNSNNNTISDNNVSNNDDGIYFDNSNNNTISGNTASINDNGIYFDSSNNNTISGNNVSNSDLSGITFDNSNNNTISGNNASNNTFGIYLACSCNNAVSGNNTCNNNYLAGIYLFNSSSSTISGNNASNNNGGIDLDSSSNNAITRNTVSFNYYGIYLDSSRSNKLYLNNFKMNKNYNVYCTNSTNLWTSTKAIIYTYNGSTHTNYLGNYWDDYKAIYPYAKEIECSGIWDTPYKIMDSPSCYGFKADNYPLIEQWENYNMSTELAVHNTDTGKSYTTIQAAIDDYDTKAGHTITVDSGTYNENVVLRKTLSLIGTGRPTVDGKKRGDVIKITASNCVVNGFRCINSAGPWTGGIKIESDYNVVENNSCEYNIGGITILWSSNNVILNNTCNANQYGGFSSWDSSHNTITGNNVSNNNGDGISLSSSSNYNTISGNNANDNNYGIGIWDSRNNKIYLNNFMNNTANVYSYNSTNIWSSTEKIAYTYNRRHYTNYLGNYWSDYTGSDGDGDGIGDTPYSIYGDNDRYPLMVSWEKYFAPTENSFDTGPSENPYPSISGTHNGTITLNKTITVQTLYTYPCPGTGGHTKYARIWNDTWSGKAAYWAGYQDDWHNISFNDPITLFAAKEYYYEIRTGSYPQIHHTHILSTPTGFITCTEFVDVNRKSTDICIPAIKLVAAKKY